METKRFQITTTPLGKLLLLERDLCSVFITTFGKGGFELVAQDGNMKQFISEHLNKTKYIHKRNAAKIYQDLTQCIQLKSFRDTEEKLNLRRLWEAVNSCPVFLEELRYEYRDKGINVVADTIRDEEVNARRLVVELLGDDPRYCVTRKIDLIDTSDTQDLYWLHPAIAVALMFSGVRIHLLYMVWYDGKIKEMKSKGSEYAGREKEINMLLHKCEVHREKRRQLMIQSCIDEQLQLEVWQKENSYDQGLANVVHYLLISFKIIKGKLKGLGVPAKYMGLLNSLDQKYAKNRMLVEGQRIEPDVEPSQNLAKKKGKKSKQKKGTSNTLYTTTTSTFTNTNTQENCGRPEMSLNSDERSQMLRRASVQHLQRRTSQRKGEKNSPEVSSSTLAESITSRDTTLPSKPSPSPNKQTSLPTSSQSEQAPLSFLKLLTFETESTAPSSPSHNLAEMKLSKNEASQETIQRARTRSTKEAAEVIATSGNSPNSKKSESEEEFTKSTSQITGHLQSCMNPEANVFNPQGSSLPAPPANSDEEFPPLPSPTPQVASGSSQLEELVKMSPPVEEAAVEELVFIWDPAINLYWTNLAPGLAVNHPKPEDMSVHEYIERLSLKPYSPFNYPESWGPRKQWDPFGIYLYHERKLPILGDPDSGFVLTKVPRWKDAPAICYFEEPVNGPKAKIVHNFDEDFIEIFPAKKPRPGDFRADPTCIDHLSTDFALTLYQAYEQAGYTVHRFDRHPFYCDLKSCGKLLHDVWHKPLSCPGCGPFSEVRFCDVDHLLQGVSDHHAECSKQPPNKIWDRATQPQHHFLNPPLIAEKHGMKWESIERHRQQMYHIFKADEGEYFLFDDYEARKEGRDNKGAGKVTHIVKFREYKEDQDKFDRLIQAAFFGTYPHFTFSIYFLNTRANSTPLDHTNVPLLHFLYRIIRRALSHNNIWTHTLELQLTHQMGREFNYPDFHLLDSKHACRCQWDNKPHKPECDSEDFHCPRTEELNAKKLREKERRERARTRGYNVKQTSGRTPRSSRASGSEENKESWVPLKNMIEKLEKEHYILRMWRRNKPGAKPKDWMARAMGKGFIGVPMEQKTRQPDLGEGWEGWGHEGSDIWAYAAEYDGLTGETDPRFLKDAP
ncbi:MAG: hypothetical protein M1834_002924 [Cirrosporium novae-zelandiae]|nr:MAG: hypothetical protein M1834_002924 [Cirrosporium novae-zelandiae]